MFQNNLGNVHLCCGEAIEFYDKWKSPVVIVCDGPYGINGYPGDLLSPYELGNWYEPHIKKWSSLSTPMTTLWFWNTELGWTNVHPILEKYGWQYVSCCVWDKGISHIAGNTNTKTIRHLPIVTEICVQYVKKPVFLIDGKEFSMQEWLRYEWKRTGLPLSKTNEACGVKNAATRKYFTNCHLWYMPPSEAFEKFSNYANFYGDQNAKPYCSIDGKKSISKNEWEAMRSKFYCPIGITNVWQESPLRGKERLKINHKAIHLNQKPLSLIKRIIEMTSDIGDVIWDPFAGLFTTAIASIELNRICYCAEINPEIYNVALNRVQTSLQNVC